MGWDENHLRFFKAQMVFLKSEIHHKWSQLAQIFSILGTRYFTVKKYWESSVRRQMGWWGYSAIYDWDHWGDGHMVFSMDPCEMMWFEKWLVFRNGWFRNIIYSSPEIFLTEILMGYWLTIGIIFCCDLSDYYWSSGRRKWINNGSIVGI